MRRSIFILGGVMAVAVLSSMIGIHEAVGDGGSISYLPLIVRAQGNPLHSGIATYYDATGDGACMFGPSPNDLMVAAMNNDEYNNAAYCGAYVQVIGPKGSVIARIVDLCPECHTGHLDLSQQAFAAIADLPLGVVSITWRVVSPAIPGPIAYHFKEGSNQYLWIKTITSSTSISLMKRSGRPLEEAFEVTTRNR